MTHLILTGLNKSYGAIRIANDMTLAVPKGQALGIIGPNGAGKSSLFNLISGDAAPDSGDVIFADTNITSLPSRARASRGIGRTYQIPRPFGGMTVFENLLVAARFAGDLNAAEAREVCKGVLHETGMEALAEAPASSLRLLDRKRLELSRALVTGPRLLLLDEIAGGLTDAECASLIELIGKLNADGITVLWIEHVLHALVKVASRIIAVNAGDIIADGAPEEVMRSQAVREIYLGSAEAVA
ncbi:ABC transporter ATP-binding protein [Thalassovita sp.]|uniref:ABC transporter ATP-binding protein n=1 Tax=Thalassovita sp. TaxID=1979401 RepID=UPI002881ADD7|nr:ABC transporter ATP-binding protein [Thalassovita sp.]MDF1804434.1 ABC transporter ATP-binding protein [Thalassovita sp.]